MRRKLVATRSAAREAILGGEVEVGGVPASKPATLAATIANMSSNIEHVNVTEKDGRISTIEFVVTVSDRIHLARIMKKLRSLAVVNRIWRR